MIRGIWIWLGRTSISQRFFAAGSLVMCVAAYIMGTWVITKIEEGVVQNYGTAAALYIEGFISEHNLEGTQETDEGATADNALRDAFVEGPLRQRVVTYKIWNRDGIVIESFDQSLEGKQFEITDALATAWSGTVASNFDMVELHAESDEAVIGLPLLEVYVPVRSPQTGEIVSVVEFYERAETLADDLMLTRRQTWYVVIAIFAASGALLFGIVHSASRLIENQRKLLGRQLNTTKEMLARNAELSERITASAARSTSQADRVMQRIGHDLHDGVAQHLSLLALRLEGAGLKDTEDGQTIKQALGNAMAELRAISRGLSLPDIEKLSLSEIAVRAVADHNRAFGAKATLDDQTGELPPSGYAIKLCLYRVIQELLANTEKHAKADNVAVKLINQGDTVTLLVNDDGTGFNSRDALKLRAEGGQGLIGLTDRLTAFGCQLEIDSAPGRGSAITVTLPIKEDPA